MLRFLMALTLTLLPVSVSAEGKFFDSNGVQIHYYDQGTGEPVVLIHGLTQSAARWEMLGITDALTEAGYRVIAFDARGHGESGKPHDPAQYGLEMSEDVARLLDHLSINQAHVVGYSMGGAITNSFRATHPDRILTATLGGSGALNEDSDWIRFKSEYADGLERGTMGPMLRRGSSRTDEEVDAISQQVRSQNDMQALAAILRSSLARVASPEELRSNKVPTLALIGETDPNKKDVDAMVGVMANLEVVVIPGADHGAALRDPMFLAETLKFLAKHRQTASDN